MKRMVCVLLTVCALWFLSACSANTAELDEQILKLQEENSYLLSQIEQIENDRENTTRDLNNANDALNIEITNLKNENETLRAEIETLKEKVNTINDDTKKPEEEPKDNNSGFQEVFLGDTLELEFATITIDSAAWSDTLKPTDTSGVYSYMPDQENESYFYLSGTLKNTSGGSYSVEEIEAEFIFDNKYTYSAYVKADDGGNDFYGDYVKPLSSVKYYITTSLPDEIKDTYSTCTINLGFAENFNYISYKGFESCDYFYTITLTK